MIIIEIKVRINELEPLQSLCTLPPVPESVENIVSSMKPTPGAKKVGNSCYRTILHSE